MANRIAGITVEIGGDVGPLSRALESCNRTIKTRLSDEISDEMETMFADVCVRKQDAKVYNKDYRYYRLLNEWMIQRDHHLSLAPFFQDHDIERIIIYGAGDMGRHLAFDLLDSEIKVEGYMDSNAAIDWKDNFRVYGKNDMLPKVDAVIVTPVLEYKSIRRILSSRIDMKDVQIFSLEEVIFHN